MTDQSELQGEIAALSCLIVALGSILPLSCQIRLSPAFESQCEEVRQRLKPEELLGFDRAALSLRSTRQIAPKQRRAEPYGPDQRDRAGGRQ